MFKKTIIICIIAVTFFAYKGEVAKSLPSVELVQKAREQANSGEWQQAIETYNKILAAAPSDAASLARRGFAYANLGDYHQAFADFTCATEFDTNSPDIYLERSRLHAWLGLRQLCKQDALQALALSSGLTKEPDHLVEHARLLYYVKSKPEADAESRKILASIQRSNDVGKLLVAFNAHQNLAEYQDCVDILTQALKLTPECSYLYLLRAGVYSYLKKWELAVSDYDQYIAINNKNPSAFSGRGYCYYWQNKLIKALPDLDRAIALAPNSAWSFYWRGRANEILNRTDEATRDFSSAIKLESTDADSYEERAWLYYHEKQFAKALTDTQQALLFNPISWRTYCAQAWAHDEVGDFTKANEDYNKAVTLAPKVADVYVARGMFYRDHKKYARAIEDLTEAIYYDPKDAVNFCARGSALVSIHQYERAIADCNQSLKLNANRTHPHVSRGIAYSRLGKYKLSLLDLDEVIRQCPKYGEAYFERSLVYKLLGKNCLSKTDLKKAKVLGYQSPKAM